MHDFFKIEGASEEAIRMRMFPLSLREQAYQWMKNQPPGSLSSWDVLVKKFIDKFFPAGKQAKLRQDVNSFMQEEGAHLHEAWDRYNQLLKRCPTHAIPDWMQIRLFYFGLRMSHKIMIDAAAGGSLLKKSVEEAKDIIETMAYNSSQAVSDKVILKNSILCNILSF
ncbi:hypothetical protein RIF29_15148 [Crotalaria pallida]|uniref:Retrotransposon gag domain-containing protein n=1 Tax=Crotalaria pallida TaxID=3830 RepID=A0AAN9FCN3_CROPI